MDNFVGAWWRQKVGTLVGAWKCCLPWCGAPEGKPAGPDLSPPASGTPPSPPSRAASVAAAAAAAAAVELPDIEEEEAILEDEDEGQSTLQPLGGRLTAKRSNVQSTSPTFSILSIGRKGQRARQQQQQQQQQAEGQSSCRMQAEQGTIADLQKHHNRYLRNRRHTLANVR
ncbi:unnamed protein product [Phyllotreta striolata]|uniref:Uncharacterized protein n=1 Tax=Phyllotreta striolata TaxID=444603 RepID=A0A9N9XR79_PHYSR|nr:unnamed protein product [Phyllotreta striolata]